MSKIAAVIAARWRMAVWRSSRADGLQAQPVVLGRGLISASSAVAAITIAQFGISIATVQHRPVAAPRPHQKCQSAQRADE